MYTIEYRRNRKRIREATHSDNPQVARQKLRQRKAQIRMGTFAGPQVEPITVGERAQPILR
jgi:hypothetical protein